MTTVCVHCAHYEERERPQGTCDVTKEQTLAWWGCRNDFEKRKEQVNE